MLKKLFHIVFHFFTLTCLAAQKTSLSLSEEETAVLKRFFRAWVEETEGGYVLLGQKPVCAHGYNKEQFAVVSPWHSNSVALWEGIRVWKKLTSSERKSDISIYINENEKKISGWVHLFLINRPAFLKVFNENRSLFQYILGPRVTAEKLLKNIGVSFDKALQENTVLAGILLGYGQENALYKSRLEDITTYLAAVEDIPLKHAKYSPEEQLEGFFLPKSSACYYKTVSPSFGFNSLSEEVSDLRNLITVSSDKLEKRIPHFIFGHIKDITSQKLVNKLEKTQDKIKKILTSKTFLQDVLERTLGKKIIIKRAENFRFAIDKETESSKILARGLWEQELSAYEKEFIPYFINSLTSASLEEECDPLLTVPSLFQDISKAQKNLSETAALFSSLEKQNGVHCIIPNKLYYKILNAGEKGIKCESSKVRLRYSFFDTLGHSLQHQADVAIDLNSTISGFAYGVRGMKKGETREIYIHPSLAYGIYTPYEKGTHLRAVVTLIEEMESSSPFPKLVSVDLSFLSDNSFLSNIRKRYKDILVWNGYCIGAHLKKSKDVDLKSIQRELHNFLQEKESFSPLTNEEKDLINKIQWNVYFAK